MDSRFLFECVIAVIGGYVGASVSALGSFLIFGLLGAIGFFYLILMHDDSLISAVTGGVLFLPHVSFIGGAIAIAYARKIGIVECGKDVGRSAIQLQRWDILGVGALAGLLGYLVNRLLIVITNGYVDTIALTVVCIPLSLKYLWGLTKTNDCEGSSHAVPSPFRFFERLNKPLGKMLLSISMGVVAVLLVLLFHGEEKTTHYSEILLFFLSAASLYLLFMNYAIPATHHLAAASGAVLTGWLTVNGMPVSAISTIALIIWGVSFALFAMTSADFMKKLLYDEGDIHVDPPAMGIVITTAVAMGLFPTIDVYLMDLGMQMFIAGVIGFVSIIVNLKFLNNE